MKSTLQALLQALHEHLPESSFDVRFWDGETRHYGNGNRQFTLIIKTEAAVRRIFSDGTLGFGQEYMAGNLEEEGDLRGLLRFGFDPAFSKLKLSFGNKL